MAECAPNRPPSTRMFVSNVETMTSLLKCTSLTTRRTANTNSVVFINLRIASEVDVLHIYGSIEYVKKRG